MSELESERLESASALSEQETALAHGGSKSKAELQRLTEELSRAREALEKNGPGADSLECDILERRIELVLYELDNTGALVPERFGRDLAQAIEARGLEMREGKLMGSKADTARGFLFVNMGELDRVNVEGGHAAGDRALQETVRVMESSIQKHLAAQLE